MSVMFDYLKNRLWLTLLVLSLWSLIPRLVLLGLTVQQNSWDRLYTLSPDIHAYTAAASEIFEHANYDFGPIITYGPGYAAFLALLKTIWEHPIFPLIVQLILSTLTTLLIYLLTRKLTNTVTATVASLFHAFSWTAITLTVSLLSETLFVFLCALSILLLVIALERNRPLFALFSGLCLSAAILTRAAAFYLPVFIVFYCLVYWMTEKTRTQTIRSKFLVLTMACGIPFFISQLWCLRNENKYGMYAVSHAQDMARWRVGVWLCSEIDGISLDSAQELMVSAFHAELDIDARYHASYHVAVNNLILDAFKRHPWDASTALARNTFASMHDERGMLDALLPNWGSEITSFYNFLLDNHLGWRSTLLGFLGLLVLIWRRNYRAAAYFGILASYFWFISAFTLYQGPRVVFPAIIGYAPLIAVVIDAGTGRIRSWKKTYLI
jgi:4-amino-4-deoxy-L-arabinose transferase-like glycosyltransferase